MGIFSSLNRADSENLGYSTRSMAQRGGNGAQLEQIGCFQRATNFSTLRW
jgi:hypothetical protein